MTEVASSHLCITLQLRDLICPSCSSLLPACLLMLHLLQSLLWHSSPSCCQCLVSKYTPDRPQFGSKRSSPLTAFIGNREGMVRVWGKLIRQYLQGWFHTILLWRILDSLNHPSLSASHCRLLYCPLISNSKILFEISSFIRSVSKILSIVLTCGQ